MAEGLDVYIVDDEPGVCTFMTAVVRKFYTWGEVHGFTNADEALQHCRDSEVGIAIFVVDVFLGNMSGFSLLDALDDKFLNARSDTIMITGNASDDVVNMCLASGVNYLLEKPVKPYALQLSIRAIVDKYLNFAMKILRDPAYANSIARVE